MKKYSRQVGPNLAFWDVRSHPGEAAKHSHGCEGMLVQDMGGSVDTAEGRPENHPGKIYCLTCGHKAGRSVTAALKNKQNREGFYFPDRAEYDLVPRIFFDSGRALRYWEWTHKDDIANMLPVPIPGKLKVKKRGHVDAYRPWPGMPMSATARMKEITRPLRPYVRVKMDAEAGEYNIVHPKIIVRLPSDEFSLLDAKKIVEEFQKQENWVKSKHELNAIAVLVLSGGDVEVPLMNRPDRFVLMHPEVFIVLDKRIWTIREAKIMANEISALKDINTILDYTIAFCQAMERPDQSIALVNKSVVQAEGYKFLNFYSAKQL